MSAQASPMRSAAFAVITPPPPIPKESLACRPLLRGPA